MKNSHFGPQLRGSDFQIIYGLCPIALQPWPGCPNSTHLSGSKRNFTVGSRDECPKVPKAMVAVGCAVSFDKPSKERILAGFVMVLTLTD